MIEIPVVLNSAFQANNVNPENILEVVCNYHYLIPKSGIERDVTKKSSILNECFFSWIELDSDCAIKDASLLLRYKKGERLESICTCMTEREELIASLLWLMRLFEGKMKGKHELSSWFQKKKQEELADYVEGDTIDFKDFKYPLRVSKVVVSFKDLTNVVSSFKDLYDQEGQELSKRGFRIPTVDEWLHFAKSIEGQRVLQKQYKNTDAYEICAADSNCKLQINVKTHQLAYLDYEYRSVHPGPLRDGFYRYVQSPVPVADLFPEGYVNKEAENLRIKAEIEHEEYLEQREAWDC